MKQNPITLDCAEWDFRKVPAEQVGMCLYYEYARERNDVREIVSRWRGKLANLEAAYDEANSFEARIARYGGRWDETYGSEESATRAFWNELSQVTDSTLAQLLIQLTDFPEKPWQRLDPNLLAERKRILGFYDYLDQIVGGLLPWPLDRVISAAHGEHLGRLQEVVSFRVDWRRGVKTVIRDFSKWASKRHAELGVKKRPRHVQYEWLKQLGVFRLKRELGGWEKVREYARHHRYTPYGPDPAPWSRANAVAARHIKELFPVTRVREL